MSSLIAAARPVVRDMFTARWQLIASVLLIALPVAVVSAMTLHSRSVSDSTYFESPRYRISYEGGQCTQTPDGSDFNCDGARGEGETARNRPANFATYLKDYLPDGATVDLHASVEATIATDNGLSTKDIVMQAPLDGLPKAYAAKLSDGGIVLPKRTAQSLNVEVGDRVSVATDVSSEALTVTALSPGYLTAVGPDTLVSDAAEVLSTGRNSTYVEPPFWTVATSKDLSWGDVTALNKVGFTVTPGYGVAFPGAPAAPQDETSAPNWSLIFSDAVFAAISLASYAIAGLLIVLALSPVFALAFNRHTRIIALMRSQGASPRQVRLAVLSYAGLTGLIGGVVGILVGIIGGAVHWTATYGDWPLSAGADAQVFYLIVAVVGAILSALVPAIMVSRSSLAASIAGTEPDRILSWRTWMGIGPAILLVEVLVIAGIAIVKRASGIDAINHTATIFALVALIGLAASTPALLLGVARLTERGSLATRSAGRGLLRSSSRVLPVLAATVCLTFVGTLLTVSIAADSRASLETETQTTSAPTIVVETSELTGRDTAATSADEASADPSATTDKNAQIASQLRTVADRVAEQVGSPVSVPLRGVVPSYLNEDSFDIRVAESYECSSVNSVSLFGVNRPEDVVGSNGKSPAEDARAAVDCRRFITRFTTSSPIDSLSTSALVQTPDEVGLWALSDQEKAEAQRTLAAGGVLVARETPLHDGKVDLELSQETAPEPDVRTESLPAAAVLPASAEIEAVLSEAAAKSLNLPTRMIGYAVMLAPGARPDYDVKTLDAISEGLPEPYHDLITIARNRYAGTDYGLMVGSTAVIGISALAIILVILLSAPALRRDNATLISLGASPKLPARIAATQAALTTVVGTGLGVLLGHITVALLGTHDEYSAVGDLIALGVAPHVRPNWILVAGVVVVTAIAAALAGFIHRPGTTEPDVARRRD